MSEEPSPIVVAIEIDDPALADRMASLLGGVAGLRLAAPGEPATVNIVSHNRQSNVELHGFELTPRELDVLVVAGRRRIEQDNCQATRDFGPYRQIPRQLAS